MHVASRVLTVVVTMVIAIGGDGASAASPASAQSAGASLISSVGSRLDAPRPATWHRPPTALPHLPLDAAAYAQAKSDAERRAAAGGPGTFRRNDFAISASPSSQTLVQGGNAAYTVATTVTSGNPKPVDLSVSGLPAGVTGTFSPARVSAGESSVLTVTASAAAATGTVGLVITGTYSSPPTTHSTAVSLTVVRASADDFAIGASPSTQTVVQGSTALYTVTTAVTSGAAQTVAFSLAGLPAGATATFTPSSVTAGQNATLTVVTGAAPAGTSVLTVTGTSATAAHSTTVSLVIQVASSSGPAIGVSWNGQSQGNLAPPDPTGAIGPNSYIELINLRYGIYDRQGALLDEGDLSGLTRFPQNELTDPQIVWDPTSGLFYYLALDFYTSEYAFGYSKGSDPRSVDDFCHYSVSAFYSSLYTPDYPKLAVTRDFVLVGANVFMLLSFYLGSDIDWFVKPTDPACPGQLGAGGIFGSVKNADGSLTSTPVPAVAADATSGGWVVGTADVGTGSAAFLTVFKVGKNAQGYATLSAPTSIAVDAYAMPPGAPQAGTNVVLDTLDSRFTHAMAGYDPRLGTTGIWTGHTVFGGAGAEFRWYEIAASSTPQLAQGGAVTDPQLYVFNGAVSSDRAADDATLPAARTGSAMVAGFNTSSSATYAAVEMVSKRGASAASARVLVHQSLGPNVDFTCTGGPGGNSCRWGDYGGARPDPLTSAGGQVWLSAEWNEPATDGQATVWRTWNWSAWP